LPRSIKYCNTAHINLLSAKHKQCHRLSKSSGQWYSTNHGISIPGADTDYNLPIFGGCDLTFLICGCLTNYVRFLPSKCNASFPFTRRLRGFFNLLIGMCSVVMAEGIASTNYYQPRLVALSCVPATFSSTRTSDFVLQGYGAACFKHGV
jgi:hypothetical protein